MKSRVSHTVAILFAAAAGSFAAAQSNPSPDQSAASPGWRMSDANVPTTTPDDSALAARMSGRIAHPVPPMTFVSEPAASASRTEGPNAELADAIVQALNADPSLKEGCKLTVQPEENGTVTITGVTLTKAQAQRAMDIATDKVGAGNVISAIRPAEV
jgi:hypothetical protein